MSHFRDSSLKLRAEEGYKGGLHINEIALGNTVKASREATIVQTR